MTEMKKRTERKNAMLTEQFHQALCDLYHKFEAEAEAAPVLTPEEIVAEFKRITELPAEESGVMARRTLMALAKAIHSEKLSFELVN
jgi:ABC-type dipeptide/oligopeptide/nickel transport system ATPase component